MMNIKHLKWIKNKYPRISNLGYTILKQIWKVKASSFDFEYPTTENLATINKETVVRFNKNRILGPKRRICFAVFNNLHFNMNGDVFSCSFNADMFLGNVNSKSIREIWEGTTKAELNSMMANYNLDKCLSCKEVLNANNYSSFPGLKYDMYGSNEVKMPTQMSFELSDLCNFACIMCSEDFSSTIKKLKNVPLQKNQYTDSFIEQLDEFIPHLKIATFIGGEPLLIKSHYKIWHKIVELNPNCAIHIQTNGSFLNNEFLQLLENGNFDIGISLDSIDKNTFETIRVGSNFELVMENTAMLLEYHKNRKIGLNFNFCPLTINWKEIPNMINFANKCDVSLKILHVLSPYNLVIINKKPEYILAVFNDLSQAKFEDKKTLISNVNNNVFTDFLKNLYFHYEQSLKRESYISQISSHSIEDVYVLLESEIMEHIRFAVFSNNEKLNLLNKTKVILKDESIDCQKYVIGFMLYLLLEARSNVEINDAKSINTKINKFIKVFEELILLEKGL